MALIIGEAGRNDLVRAGTQATGYLAARFWRSMSFDDSVNAFADGDVALDSGGAVGNEADADFDATPAAPSGSAVTFQATLGAGVFNGNTVQRVGVHNDTAANVTTASTTWMAGLDALGIPKTADFALRPVLTLTLADTS